MNPGYRTAVGSPALSERAAVTSCKKERPKIILLSPTLPSSWLWEGTALLFHWHSFSCDASDYLLRLEDYLTCPLPHKKIIRKWFGSTCFIHSSCSKSCKPNANHFIATQLRLSIDFSLPMNGPKMTWLSQTWMSSCKPHHSSWEMRCSQHLEKSNRYNMAIVLSRKYSTKILLLSWFAFIYSGMQYTVRL